MPRARRVFAAPFVITALGGCKHDDKPPPRPEPRVATIDAAVAVVRPPDAAPRPDATEAPADATTIRDGANCWLYLGPHVRMTTVRCPPEGATLTVTQARTRDIRYRGQYLDCSDFSPRSGPNPPASVVVPCPVELLPTLDPGLEPTRVGDACSWKEIEVKCPPDRPAPAKDAVVYRRGSECYVVRGGLEPVRCPVGGPSLAVADEDIVSQPNGDSIQLSLNTLQCELDRNYHCDDTQHTCNPPPPRPVPCPTELLPVLIHGAEPTKSDAGRCWWHDIEVACP